MSTVDDIKMLPIFKEIEGAPAPNLALERALERYEREIKSWVARYGNTGQALPLTLEKTTGEYVWMNRKSRRGRAVLKRKENAA